MSTGDIVPRMAARAPRRSFATPFVVTLAAVPACYTGAAAPPPQRPQAPMQTVTNPPRPLPQSSPAVTPGQRWTVSRQPDGTCTASIAVACPPGVMCNPPRPQPYECPQNVSLDAPIAVVAGADSTCHVEYPDVKCKPGIVCNPPRPQPVACPTR
jgi:hypothetical protein